MRDIISTNILIIKFGAFGDVIRTSYILPGLHKKYNTPKIYWLTSSYNSFDLLRFNPYIDEIITPEYKKMILEKNEFDLAISLDDEKEILSIIGNIKCREIIGTFLVNGNVVVYNNTSNEWFDMGLVSKYGKVRADELKKLNTREHNQIFASMFDIEINEPIFFNSIFIEKRASLLFDNAFFNIGINSSAGSRWISKELSFVETIKLIEEILKIEITGRRTCVYLLGGKEEEDRHQLIKRNINSERLIDTGNNNSLLEFAAIIKNCDYIITSDSLALHLAISQNVKNLSFFAPTSAAEIGTFGTGVKVISLSSDYCSYRRDADNSTITSERILLAMKQHLAF